MSFVFSDYIKQTPYINLVDLMEKVQPNCKALIAEELILRERSKNLAAQSVVIWLEVDEGEWESYEVPFIEAKEMALDSRLQCRSCCVVIFSVYNYIRQYGRCELCSRSDSQPIGTE